MEATLKPTLKPGMEPSLAAHVEGRVKAGFDHSLSILSDHRVFCHDCERYGWPSALRIDTFRRFEGASDPDDMQLVASVCWPNDNHDCSDCKGVLVLGFGPMASPEHKRALASMQLTPTAA